MVHLAFAQEFDTLSTVAPDTPQQLTTAPGLPHGLAGAAAIVVSSIAVASASRADDVDATHGQHPSDDAPSRGWGTQAMRGAHHGGRAQDVAPSCTNHSSLVDPSTGKVSLAQLFAGVLVPEEAENQDPVDDNGVHGDGMEVEDDAAAADAAAREAAEFTALATDALGQGMVLDYRHMLLR